MFLECDMIPIAQVSGFPPWICNILQSKNDMATYERSAQSRKIEGGAGMGLFFGSRKCRLLWGNRPMLHAFDAPVTSSCNHGKYGSLSLVANFGLVLPQSRTCLTSSLSSVSPWVTRSERSDEGLLDRHPVATPQDRVAAHGHKPRDRSLKPIVCVGRPVRSLKGRRTGARRCGELGAEHRFLART